GPGAVGRSPVPSSGCLQPIDERPQRHRSGGGTPPVKIGTVAIVGMGLIGGSLGQAWRRSGAAERVIGVVRRPEARSEVLAAEAADEATTDAASAASQADLCVLCTPVESIIPLALQIIPAMQPGALLTDVGSAKERICRTLWAAAGDSVTFVGGHPM